jgi:hypothetical protein
VSRPGWRESEARLWVVVMLAQSLPYVAALVTATINAAGEIRPALPATGQLQVAPGGD